MNAVRQLPRKVAVIKPCCIGDVVMALPALDALAGGWPGAAIDVFVGPHSRPVLDFRPNITTRPIAESLTARSALRLGRELRHGAYDAVISLDRSRWLRLALETSRVSIRARAESRQPDHRHESEVYLDVVRSLNVATPFATPRIASGELVLARANQLLSGQPNRFVVLHPGGAQNPGTHMLDKRWAPDRYIELARSLIRKGFGVLFSGGPSDHALIASIIRSAGLSDLANLAGRADLATLAAVIEHAAVFVGPDTGVSHIAAATGTPTITIFGPTNPRRYRPLGAHVTVLAPPESWNISDRDLRRSPVPADMPSTQSISVQTVLDAITTITTDRRRCNE